MIDLRSDTVTRPTPAMRAVMLSAEVGDDVWGDDPTMNRLISAIAERTGKETALFFPSGTQSNLAAIMAHCGRGDAMIVGQDAHSYMYEGGGAAVLGSVQLQPIENAADGTLSLDKIAAVIKPADIHFARTRLLALENTIDGKILPIDYLSSATTLARSRGLGTHLDGARLFNAAVGARLTVSDICAPFDTVSICFSKGLGAPAGTLLVGQRDLIERAARWRKVLGGGMRQVGILAAACLHALEHHVDRLADDHANATTLAAGLRQIPTLSIDGPHTNMVFVEVPGNRCQELSSYLNAQGILVAIGPQTRLVTHLDVTTNDIHRVVAAFQSFF
ncbi:MAG: low-specificity L-threonine aldolase [Rhodospirillaceae bacterium]|nr:low-specificity L-threonine aldolase [Rhodospirillaceae bacterium]